MLNSSEEASPKPRLGFLLRNARLLSKMKKVDKEEIEKFVNSIERFNRCVVPDFEETGGPMEEGMIYLMFNSENGMMPIDSVFRLFWVNSPQLRFSFLDSFFISTKFTSGRWEKKFSKAIFQTSKHNFHQEVHVDEFEMIFDGEISTGYSLYFVDRKNNISGHLKYDPLEDGVITYFNGKMALTPSIAQKAYDIFAIKVTGKIEVQGKEIEIKDGRGIVEHSLGIFSGYNIHCWRWLNLQFPEGTLHLFHHPITMGKEGIIEAGEGAALMEGKWYHFLRDEFKIEEIEYVHDETINTEIPVKWRVVGEPFDFIVKKKAHLSWGGNIGPTNEYIANYVLEADGKWKGKETKGSGTMEYLFHV